ncbi:hypothetical protein FZC74_11765 [Sutcliffiella horikoshii]|uniref:Uncharacterized protein n=1 Tax=Sutcliffiella horikoshii TaxID=79883 RepID=A0AA95B5N1_9BACI|nr:hypothetical protein [Sutcliffiella horikoshii]TYS58479.1 hypothetical protein FZC74_11765 [Sutcliffiella horikoshii]
MDLLLWITIGFIVIGFVVLVSLKKEMESKLACIKANEESEESPTKAKSIIWWIYSATAWGIVSMGLIVWSFHNYFG